jgi:hypothetical protein
MQNFDHNIGFWEKRQFFPPKIVIITWSIVITVLQIFIPAHLQWQCPELKSGEWSLEWVLDGVDRVAFNVLLHAEEIGAVWQVRNFIRK